MDVSMRGREQMTVFAQTKPTKQIRFGLLSRAEVACPSPQESWAVQLAARTQGHAAPRNASTSA
jgi:hypothetical protein